MVTSRHFMSATGVAAVCAAIVVLHVLIGSARQQELTFQTKGDVVSVYATVHDNRGRLIPSLTRDAFEIRDEGKTVPITVFDDRPRPIRLIVLVDISHSVREFQPFMREATGHLLTHLYPGDLVRLGTFGGEVVIGPAFTRNVDELMAVLPTRLSSGGTRLWSAVDRGLDIFDDPSEPAGARQVILVFSDGEATDYGAMVDVRARAPSSDVMFYGVGLDGGRVPFGPVVWTDLMRFAENTGGGYAPIGEGRDLSKVFAGVMAELHSQYMLGFEPAKRDGKIHDIDVRVRGYNVRARKQYVAPKD